VLAIDNPALYDIAVEILKKLKALIDLPD